MERLTVFFRRGRSTVQVEDASGVTRETSGPDMQSVIDAMPDMDREMLSAWCQAVNEYIAGQPRRLKEW